MNYNPNIHHRRSIRLKGYDYSQEGLYFVTICCQNMICRFGKVENKKMILNDAGKMVDKEWLALADRFNNIVLREYIVMPNHFHGILQIVGASVGASLVDAQNDDDRQEKNGQENDRQNENGQDENGQDDNGQDDNGATTRVARTTEEMKNNVGASLVDAPTANEKSLVDAPTPKGASLFDMMDAFKSITTVEYIAGVKTNGWPRFDKKLWQRNYYEHIIRDEISYQRIANYIINNPANWKDDKFYSA